MEIWRILDIEPTKDQDIIRDAYRKRLLSVHPEEDPEGFKQLREAFEQAVRFANTPDEDETEEKDDSELSVFDRIQKEAIRIYDDLHSRIDPDRWKEFLSRPEFEELDSSDEAREALLAVFMNRIFLPKNIWELVAKSLLVKEEREQLVEKFNPDYIDYVISRSEAEDILPFEQFESRKEHEEIFARESLVDEPVYSELMVPTHPGFDSYAGDLDQYINALRFLWGGSDALFTAEDPKDREDNAIQYCSLLRYLESKDLWHPEEYYLKMRFYSFSEDPARGVAMAVPVLKHQADLDLERLYTEAARVYLAHAEEKDPVLLKEIEENTERQIAEDPKNYWVILNQVLLYRALGRYEDSAEKCVDLLADYGENTVTLNLIKELDEILVPKYEKLMEEDPENDEYLICRVRYLGQLNRWEEALALLESRQVSEEWKPDHDWFSSRAMIVLGRNQEGYEKLHEYISWMEPVIERVKEMDERGEEVDHRTRMRLSRRNSAYGALGEVCIALKKNEESIEGFRKLLSYEPGPRYAIPATLGIIKNFEDCYQYYDAMTLVEGLVNTYGSDLENLMIIHQNDAYRIDENQSVIDDYYRIIESEPTHPRPYLLAFRVFMEYDQTDDAMTVVSRAKENGVSKLLTDYMELCIKRAGISNGEEALAVLDEMIEMRDELISLKEQNPENEVFNISDLRYQIADLAGQIKRNEGSCKVDFLEEADQALKEAPANWDFLLSCLMLKIRNMKDQDDPELMAMDLAGFGLRESDIYYALGLYFASNRRDPIRAIPCLEKVLQTAPKHSFALFRLMHQYRDRFRKLGDLEDLKRAEEKADVLHQIEPTFANCLECSDIYLYVEKFDKAAACYEKALEIREEDYRGYNGLGLVAMDQKEYDQAAKYFRIAISRNSGRRNIGYIYRNLIKCYRRSARLSEALAVWEEMASNYEPSLEDLEEKASILFSSKRYEEGDRVYHQVLDLAKKAAEEPSDQKDWDKIKDVLDQMIRIYEAAVFMDFPESEREARKKDFILYLQKNDLLLTPKKSMFGSNVRNTSSGKLYLEAKEKPFDAQTGRSVSWIYSSLALFFLFTLRDYQTAILYFLRWIEYNKKELSACSNYDLEAIADRKNDLAIAFGFAGDPEYARKYAKEAKELLLSRYPEEVVLRYPGRGLYIGKALMQASGILGEEDYTKYVELTKNCVYCDFCKHNGCYEEFLLIARVLEIRGEFEKAAEYYDRAYQKEPLDCEAKVGRDLCLARK